MGLGFVVGVFGVLILGHAAYSTIQYRGLLKITEEEFSGPPMNVVAELLLGLVFCMWAGLTVPGKFLSILPDSEENRYCCLSFFRYFFCLVDLYLEIGDLYLERVLFVWLGGDRK
ncbi:hypothetical protein I3842_09G174500 [Carya illinoinensis]|uniref:Membrane magnesium transporter n=1 Tax=Carya illinoinensis TaxID=32201 RepID=A0A922J774_CARIL|nr:hypothetical protein I3842_09G174500 [Carya illinoinensis]